mgnify:CR=1 FL=1
MKESLKVREILRDHGLKVTAFREELLQHFHSASAPLSAVQIFERLRSNRRLRKTRFDRATLFRNCGKGRALCYRDCAATGIAARIARLLLRICV